MASKADIEYHYDVDNDFFALFLDTKFRAYSCGVWKTATTLEQAQIDKLNRLCRYANVQENHCVIDVGCGWGGLMNHIDNNYSRTQIKGLTLSTKQFEYINSVSKSNLSVDLKSWQDFPVPDKKFDSIISIGAFEHFATYQNHLESRQREVYKQFFDWCLSISTPSAQIGLQTIVISRAPSSRSEVKDTRYLLDKVFPGSALPSISDIQAAILDKYEISAIRKIGLDYSRTLLEWDKKLESNKDLIILRYGKNIYDHYKIYFEAAKRCFDSKYIDLVQISLTRVQQLRVF